MKTFASTRGMMLVLCLCCIPLFTNFSPTVTPKYESTHYTSEWNPKLWKASSLIVELIMKLEDGETVKRKALLDMRNYLHWKKDKKEAGTTFFNGLLYSINESAGEDGVINTEIISYLYGVYSEITKKIEKISTRRSIGKGETTGHIADLIVVNDSDTPYRLEPQTFYIPGGYKYQSYVGRIGENEYLPPYSTVIVPVHGYCADPFKPPVPNGEPMPDFSEWIPALEYAADHGSIITQISTVEDDIEKYGPPPQIPEPMNPPGEGDDPSVPEPMNPPKGKNVPSDFENAIPPAGPVIRLSDKEPLAPFNPLVLPEEIDKPGKEALSGESFHPTYPGTDVKIKTRIDVNENPDFYVPVIVAALKEIEESAESIQEDPFFDTPFSPEEEKELEALIQQPFWIYMSLITNGDYDEDKFEENVHEQLENVTGVSYDDLDDNGKINIDNGASSFWTAYTAVGLEAKVISADSPEIDDSAPGMADVLISATSPGCECDSITYDLSIIRNEIVVHSDKHNSRNSPSIAVDDLEYGDEFEVTLSNIDAHCQCDDNECEFYKPQSDNKNSTAYIKTDETKPGKVEIQMGNDGAGTISKNCNCQNSNKSWNSGEDEYSFDLITSDEGTKENAIFQRLTIRAYCELEDCRRKLCKKTIQLNFVKK